MSLVKLFSSSIYRKALSVPNKGRFNTELAEECYNLRRIDDKGNAWSQKNYLGGYTSYSSYSNMHTWSSTFALLEKKITPHVYKFLEHQGYDTKEKSICMSTFWVNIMGHQTTHSWHIHPRSVVSGTYYVQLPKDSVGIKFQDPRMNLMMSCLPKKTKLPLEFENFVAVKPNEGDIVLFESWMSHEVPPNPSKKDRISVSFNYEWFD
ncbi:MAG: hypothetical protein RJB66_87 [Pseudomonadota bacterium]|jgi:uncharacterized protein (TIGR02466 family)